MAKIDGGENAAMILTSLDRLPTLKSRLLEKTKEQMPLVMSYVEEVVEKFFRFLSRVGYQQETARRFDVLKVRWEGNYSLAGRYLHWGKEVGMEEDEGELLEFKDIDVSVLLSSVGEPPIRDVICRVTLDIKVLFVKIQKPETDDFVLRFQSISALRIFRLQFSRWGEESTTLSYTPLPSVELVREQYTEPISLVSFASLEGSSAVEEITEILTTYLSDASLDVIAWFNDVVRLILLRLEQLSFHVPFGGGKLSMHIDEVSPLDYVCGHPTPTTTMLCFSVTAYYTLSSGLGRMGWMVGGMKVAMEGRVVISFYIEDDAVKVKVGIFANLSPSEENIAISSRHIYTHQGEPRELPSPLSIVSDKWLDAVKGDIDEFIRGRWCESRLSWFFSRYFTVTSPNVAIKESIWRWVGMAIFSLGTNLVNRVLQYSDFLVPAEKKNFKVSSFTAESQPSPPFSPWEWVVKLQVDGVCDFYIATGNRKKKLPFVLRLYPTLNIFIIPVDAKDDRKEIAVRCRIDCKGDIIASENEEQVLSTFRISSTKVWGSEKLGRWGENLLAVMGEKGGKDLFPQMESFVSEGGEIISEMVAEGITQELIEQMDMAVIDKLNSLGV